MENAFNEKTLDEQIEHVVKAMDEIIEVANECKNWMQTAHMKTSFLHYQEMATRMIYDIQQKATQMVQAFEEPLENEEV